MAESDNTVKIAVIEEQIKGIREQNRTQYSNLNDKIEFQGHELEMMNKKMDEVIAFKNQHKGVVAGIAAVMGFVGGVVVKIVNIGG